MLADRYVERIHSLLREVAETQRSAIREAAARVAGAIRAGGIVHVFGCTHAEMVGQEVAGRAGGLVPVNIIHDPSEGTAERVEGYAAPLLKRYDRKYGLRTGEVLVVVSNSGINALPVEVALEGRKRGLYVIALTNLTQSRQATSRHSSGQRLFEAADLVLDNRVATGDAMVEFEAVGQHVGAGSSFAGMLIMQMVMLTAMEMLAATGYRPPILRSQNLPGADAWNEELRARYQGRLAVRGV